MKRGSMKKPTLDRPAIYKIKILGELNPVWVEWPVDITFNIEGENDLPVTVLTGTFDQAALHGLLRRLYSMGLPLLSVIYIQDK